MNKSLEELACLYVLDQLEPRERAGFEARLLRYPELATFVRELEPTLARGVGELPQHTPSAGVLNQIEARIDALGDTAAAREPRRAPVLPFNFFSLARWGIAAVIAVSLATIAIQSLREPGPAASQPVLVFVGLDANKNTFAELPMRDGAKDPDARFIQLATLAENYWRKPGELPVRTQPAPGDNRGYALFDPASRQGFIVIEQLPVATEGQRYGNSAGGRHEPRLLLLHDRIRRQPGVQPSELLRHPRGQRRRARIHTAAWQGGARSQRHLGRRFRQSFGERNAGCRPGALTGRPECAA
jgi:hypothetical protein